MGHEYCQGDSGKIIYHSVQDAFNAILSQNKRGKRSKATKTKALKPYRCDDCGGLHIGTVSMRPHPRDY